MSSVPPRKLITFFPSRKLGLVFRPSIEVKRFFFSSVRSEKLTILFVLLSEPVELLILFVHPSRKFIMPWPVEVNILFFCPSGEIDHFFRAY